MRREEFLRQLEYLLQDIPEEDKTEALQYYRDYLEEAGEENEERAIADFGSPERVAAIIRADMMGNLEKGGEFTETGYGDERFRDPNFEVAKRFDLPEEKEPKAEYKETKETKYKERYAKNMADEEYNRVKKEPWTNKTLKTLLWAALIIVAFPFALSVLGVLTAVVGVYAGAVITMVCLTLAALFVFVVVGVFGVVFLIDAQIEGLLLVGISILGLGCGIICMVITVLMTGVLLPIVWKGLVKCCKALTKKGEKEAQHE